MSKIVAICSLILISLLNSHHFKGSILHNDLFSKIIPLLKLGIFLIFSSFDSKLFISSILSGQQAICKISKLFNSLNVRDCFSLDEYFPTL